MIDLRGTWRGHVADDELRRAFTAPDFDDRHWHELHVPGHWREHPALADNDRPVLHRRAFTAERPAPGRRSWLSLDGVFYQGDVWLDGAYLGDTEGYFVRHAFEVTELLTARTDHTLAVEVTCAPQRDRTAKRNLTGVFQHWDAMHPEWNPGGIWLPVGIHETGAVRIDRLRLLCLEASPERAVLSLRAVLDVAGARQIRVRTRAGTTLHEEVHAVAAGTNRVEWRVTVERPRLWWPHSLGEPHLTDVTVEVEDATTGERLDQTTRRTGLRQVRAKGWVFEINGERLHLKGANLAPTRMAIGSATADELATDLRLAKELGLDLLRLHAHITHPALYDLADELGMLLWQDLPLQWGYARSVRRQAVRQARAAVDLLGHHPSLIHWCGHNEPIALPTDPESPGLDALAGGAPRKAAQMVGRYLALQELPTWNKTVLDAGIHRALTGADPSRPVTAHSGVLPGPLSGGTDTHLYFGWYHGHERDLPRLLRTVPRLARFVSEFGAQAVPQDAGFCEPERWPDLDWDALGHHHSLQKVFFDRNVAPAQFATFDDWRDATQSHQAELLRRHIEELRRIKYRPGGGFALFSLHDPIDHRAVSWSIYGHDRAPKAAVESVRAACRPVIITTDRPPATVTAGDRLALDVHAVSDIRHSLRRARVRATLALEAVHAGADPTVLAGWEWQGDVGADACSRVGRIGWEVPRDGLQAGGHLLLELTLDHPEATATNRYRISTV